MARNTSFPTAETARDLAGQVYHAAVRAASALDRVRESLAIEGRTLRAGGTRLPLQGLGRVAALGAGKAACAMARAAEEQLGARLDCALAVTKDEEDAGSERRRVLHAGHPIPNERSLAAGEEALRLASSLDEDDLLLVLLSGGASALLEAVAGDVTLQDLRATTDLLLRAGAPIQDLNAVRRSLSRIKAGGLAAATKAKVVCLVVSDVLGNDLAVIGSGPCLTGALEQGDPVAVLERYDLWKRVPASVRQACRARTFRRASKSAEHHVIADIWTALGAARDAAQSLGLKTAVLTGSLKGEASAAGAVLGAIAKDMERARPMAGIDCYLAGGETTVRVLGDGEGGRSQEIALRAALEMDGAEGVALLAAGTDGSDGPTDAAGAIVDGATAARIRAAGVDPWTSLARNDSYHALAAADALLRTGPTGTNVNDLVIAVHGPNGR